MGLLLVGLGFSMFLPMFADIIAQSAQWVVFLKSALICIFVGSLVSITSTFSAIQKLSPQQSVFLSISFWTIMPIFGMIPFMIGAPHAGFTDAFFEAMSGFTTTGSTVFISLHDLPPSIKLWRAMTQWYGGIGIVLATMIFFPELRMGGMQIFRSDIFNDGNKILPRLIELSMNVLAVYLVLTILCALIYSAVGMNILDAITHAMTTLATGGFANYDSSFIGTSAPICYVASIFMILAALPFIRYIQMTSDGLTPLLRDPQIKLFLIILFLITCILVFVQVIHSDRSWDLAFQHAFFNSISLLSGTGYVSDDYNSWGSFSVLLLFFAGLIGGCAGSTSCSIKIFRYQILFLSLRTQIKKIRWPNGIFLNKYNGKIIEFDVINSVAVFFILFLLSFIILAIFLAMTGLDFITALSGAASALANIGPGFGDKIGPLGNFSTLPDIAKWILIFGMLLGRLEMIAVYILLIKSFWRH